jgi:hypothetical protein
MIIKEEQRDNILFIDRITMEMDCPLAKRAVDLLP